MNRMRTSLAVLTTAFIGTVVSACGSSDDSTFGNGRNNGNGDGSENGGFVDGNGGVAPGSLGDLEACATSSAAGELTPTNLIVMFDRSGSMFNNGAQATKWDPVSKVMSEFFTSPQSAGLSASLTYFPLRSGRCSPDTYARAAVSLRPLPNPAFATSIGDTDDERNTPTRPAMSGAVAQAEAALRDHPGVRSVIVFVTDGQPQGCNGNSDPKPANNVTETENVARAVADRIKTYVIGVGNSGNLDTNAAAGGTGAAIKVTTDTAESAGESFRNALGLIRSQVGDCTFGLPAPPDGKTLDTNAVNVVFTPGGGAPQTLAYSAECSGEGWRYDNPTTPTRVELCGPTCNTVKADKASKIAIAFGCSTRGKIF